MFPRKPRRRAKSHLLPLLPRRDIVLFPRLVSQIVVMRQSSLRVVEDTWASGRTVAVVTRRDPRGEEINQETLYPLGTEATIDRVLRMPDGSSTVWVEGLRRIQIKRVVPGDTYFQVEAIPLEDPTEKPLPTQALMRAVLALFEKCVKLSLKLAEDLYIAALNIEQPGWLADFIASALDLELGQRQEVLETLEPHRRLERVSILLAKELDVLELQSQISSKVQEEVDKAQRQFYLREQLRAIQKELGEQDPQSRELNELRVRVEKAGMPEEVRKKAEEEMERLKLVPSAAPEVSVIRTYLDWLVSLPWAQETQDNLDLARASQVLKDNHFGLEKVKERVLEYMAVRKVAGARLRSPILCFVGPPGVGKTSLGRSIAQALGRRFVRLSLGGIRDEAEIRGHRRTYVGALPGRILQTMRTAGTTNPVFMMDEIDKVGVDFRGDPSAALLEVLDPEQNHSFSDHYLEVPYNLSRVLFITTANMVDSILPALRDRLEVLELPGYIEEEKLHIARHFLFPRMREEHGLVPSQLSFTQGAIRALIRGYTREAGVRNLERELGSISRKVAKQIAEGKKPSPHITSSSLSHYLGPPRFFWGMAEEKDQVGVATGVARTEMGGDVMSIEVTLMQGKGTLVLTGQLGEVMRESAQAALSYARSRAAAFGLNPQEFEKTDVHIHVPAAATPKEGPSAGITMATALLSALTHRPVRREVALTGEITLRGRVLPVGGIREKVLAAHRAGIRTFILPRRNEKDLRDVPPEVRRHLHFVLVETMEEALDQAFLPLAAEAGP